MNAKLKQKIEEFENKRIALLDEIESLSKEKLNARPIEGKWSVLEIIEHLVIAEREVMGGLKDYEILENRKQSFRNGIMYRLVMFVLFGDVCFKSWDSCQSSFKKDVTEE